MARTGSRRGARSVLVRVVTAVVLVAVLVGCGAAEDDSGLHGVRMMVPNSPGGGYDLTARTAVKVMADEGITDGIGVFNVIGASGTVAMARLMNEAGNDELMMTMGLGVVGAGYTNGSTIHASDATPLAKIVEEPEVILVPGDSPLRSLDDFVRGGPIRRR